MASDHPAKLTFVLGGARSGKSLYAENLVRALPSPWTYIATAQSFDSEMAARIAEHRQRRHGAGWSTVEAPFDLAGALRSIPDGQPVLVDCLTLWLTNLMLAEQNIAAASQELAATLTAMVSPCVLVSNEVGLGIVPDNALARTFRDHAGRLHQMLAAQSDRVVFMVAGLPMVVK